jgi:hypothetical protein
MQEKWYESFTKTTYAWFQRDLLPLVADLLGLGLLQAEMVRGQRVPTMIPFHMARGGGERGMSERGSSTCQTWHAFACARWS